MCFGCGFPGFFGGYPSTFSGGYGKSIPVTKSVVSPWGW